MRTMSAKELPAFGSEIFPVPFDATGHQEWVRGRMPAYLLGSRAV